LYTERLVSRKSLEQIFTPFQGPYREPHLIERGLYSRHKLVMGGLLQNGLGATSYGTRALINGFCSAILRYPDDRTLVVVLENLLPDLEGVSDPDLGEPMTVANALSAIAFGLPRDSSPASGKTLT